MEPLEKLRITKYREFGKLPDPFLFEDGSRVKTEADWRRRREEIKKTAVELQYGTLPPEPEVLEVEPLYLTGPGGLENYRVITGTREHPVCFTLLLQRPEGEGPYPVVIDGDLCWRGIPQKEVWEQFTKEGIAFASFNRTEIVPDVLGAPRTSAIHQAWPEKTFGAIAAWAWGYSRAADALLKLGLADAAHIVFTGLSRGGKTALLAGALDERAWIVNPEAAGAGGHVYRSAMEGICEDGSTLRNEELEDIVTRFPYWYGPEIQSYLGRVKDLPFDNHELKALVAPRVLFDSEAKSDLWAGPVEAYQCLLAAGEVYAFLGARENLLWYWRNGYHNQTPEDFSMLLRVILNRLRGENLRGLPYYNVPFAPPEQLFDWSAPEREDDYPVFRLPESAELPLDGGEFAPESLPDEWKALRETDAFTFPWDKNGYTPECRARLGWNGKGLFALLYAKEETIRAEAKEFGDMVCFDSCLEFFLQPNPAKTTSYANFECNPKGVMLLGIGPDRDDRENLNAAPEGMRILHSAHKGGWWAVSYFIPASFLRERFSAELGEGKVMRANFYCCGDKTQYPHFGQWKAMDPALQPAADFHRQEWFGTLRLK